MNKKEVIKKQNNTKKNNKENNNDIVKKVKEFIDYYKKNVSKYHVITTIIFYIIFLSSISYFMSNLDIVKEISANMNTDINIFSYILKNKIFTMLLIIVSGITPYFFIPVIGVILPYSFSIQVVIDFVNSGNNYLLFIVNIIFCLIQLIGVSLAVAFGIKLCILSTKRFRYNQKYKGFSFYDLKKAFYETKNDKKKLEELEASRKKKLEKNEKLNVKIPYFMYIYGFVVSTVIVVITTLITKI